MDKAGWPAGQPDLRQSLRRETAALHARLDAGLAFPARADRPWYRKFLSTNTPVIVAEQALARSGIETLLPDWPERERRRALEHDLHALDLVPAHPSLPCIASDHASLLGWAYVLEGSRLGARVVLKFIEETGSAEIRGATEFLRHGQDKGFWMSFSAMLRRSEHDQAFTDRACTAARSAFSLFLAAQSMPIKARSAVQPQPPVRGQG